jgi:hypothetical protein
MKDIREDPRRRWLVHYLRRGPPLPYEGTVRLTRAVLRHSRSSSPPVRPSPQPVPDQFVSRDGGRRRPCDFDQRAVPEKPDGGLHRRLRKSRLAGQRLQADVDRSTLGSEQTCPQDQVDQKRRGRMILSGQALAFSTDVLGFRLLTDQPFSDKQRWLELGIPGADTRVVPVSVRGHDAAGRDFEYRPLH